MHQTIIWNLESLSLIQTSCTHLGKKIFKLNLLNGKYMKVIKGLWKAWRDAESSLRLVQPNLRK